MPEKDMKLYINILGSFSLTYNGKTIDDRSIRSKKFWNVLEYLIVFRNRDISQSELIELIYPEGKSDNPGNALKTLVHRIRNGLAELDYPDSRDMIIQTRGTYAWNIKPDHVIDVDRFEMFCNKGNASDIPEEEKLEYYLKAIEIYKGDFLHKSAFEPWVIQFNVFYHTMYCNIVHKAVEMLKRRRDYEKVVELCEKALTVDAFDEFLYYNLIRGLIDINNAQAALVEYRKMSDLFYREFGVTPSDDLIKLYREIIKTNKKVETDINVIKENMKEDDTGRGAFYCEYEIFKDIYRLEVRATARNGETVYLCLLTVTTKSGDIPAVKVVSGYMDKLADCVKKTLRNGDIFAQYSVSQFVLLMPFTTLENGEVAIKRALKMFNTRYPYCPLSIIYSFQPVGQPLMDSSFDQM